MKYGDNKNQHMKSVAEMMYANAPALGLSEETAYVVGLLHDVGYIRSKDNHEVDGAEILKEMGFKDEYCDAIKYHNRSGYDLLREGIEITPMMMLLQFADMSVDKFGNKVGFDGRLKDLNDRYRYGSPIYHNIIDQQEFLQKVFNLHHLNREEQLKPISKQEFDKNVQSIKEQEHIITNQDSKSEEQDLSEIEM